VLGVTEPSADLPTKVPLVGDFCVIIFRMRKRFLFITLASCVLLYLLNSIALHFDLYYTVWWADTITHALAGVVVAAAFVSMMLLFSKKLPSTQNIVLFVLAIGVLWEVLEAMTGMTFVSDPGFNLDTGSDLFFDVFGAFLFSIFTL